MRTTVMIGLSLCVAALPAAGQSSDGPGAAVNVLTRYLDQADIHPPAPLGRLTIFPVCLKSVHRLGNVLTMDQALGKGLLVIEELPTAQVNRARFVNKSGSHMVFLMSGEVITGGKQNRTLTDDALLKPDSATVLPLYCVQKGRWRGQDRFAAVGSVAPQGVREQAAQKAGQGAVWGEVARANRRLGSSTASDDLAAAMTRPENVRVFDKLRRRLRPHLPAGCAGVVVACDRRIVGADLFNAPELFSAMRGKVLDSYLSQYSDQAQAAAPARDARPTQHDVRAYLQACYRARFTPADTRGVGRIYDVRGARFGQTLAYEPAYVVVPRERRIRPRPKGGSYMVHTALMQRVVPVRPAPVPVPEPRPPRPVPRLPRPVPRLPRR